MSSGPAVTCGHMVCIHMPCDHMSLQGLKCSQLTFCLRCRSCDSVMRLHVVARLCECVTLMSLCDCMGCDEIAFDERVLSWCLCHAMLRLICTSFGVHLLPSNIRSCTKRMSHVVNMIHCTAGGEKCKPTEWSLNCRACDRIRCDCITDEPLITLRYLLPRP